MKKSVIGILAHVDAGKTTLSEGLLYTCGALKQPGRVDHQNAFLDTYALERERGITIFSKQAILPLPSLKITLLDTPGHVDFSAEMERTLQVLDYAILVISGTDGVQSHTQTLWNLLSRNRIPTFVFINKTDLAGTDTQAVLRQLQALDDGCIDFSSGTESEAFFEAVVMRDEALLEAYLSGEAIADSAIARLIQSRSIFPCYCGSALKLEGVSAFLSALERYVLAPKYPSVFGAKVYKIDRDAQGARLTCMKITGGTLKVKDLLSNETQTQTDGLAQTPVPSPGLSPQAAEKEPESIWKEKVDQIRIYSGNKYQAVERVEAGSVCAVTGLTHTQPGQGLGCEPSSPPPLLLPVMTYQLLLPEGCDSRSAYLKLLPLQEEDPQMHITWNAALQEIHLQPMGDVQLEVLQKIIAQRFGLSVAFGSGNIVYRETIAAPVEGIGHFEPLRHYAEVHLLLEPAPRGSGLHFASGCSEDILHRNWQRLILTHLAETEHPGVLTGSPITDMRITIVAGRAHIKHTEGGDFRQATYRALRQGLKQAQSILLEPWYQFRLQVPQQAMGRAMADLQRMHARFQSPLPQAEDYLFHGSAPVAAMKEYSREVAAYTHGQGQLSCVFCGYEPCLRQDEIVAASGYDSDSDTEHPADSVFCSHGTRLIVRWDQVREHMHVDSGLRLSPQDFGSGDSEKAAPAAGFRREAANKTDEDEELMAIFQRTYGEIKQRTLPPQMQPAKAPQPAHQLVLNRQPEYLLIDGYNIIFAWDELKALAKDNIESARQALIHILSNYQGFQSCILILVFDAYKVKQNPGAVVKEHNIYVVYTKEAETADAYIEKATYDLAKQHRVRVATSDRLEQMIILGHGAQRVSAKELYAEVERANGRIAALIEQNNRQSREMNRLQYKATVVKQRSAKKQHDSANASAKNPALIPSDKDKETQR